MPIPRNNTRNLNRNKVAVLIPYFGRWPVWIDLYFYSCSRQAGVDFVFYTDCQLPNREYKNIIFHPISFGEYCKFVSEQLSIPFRPDNAYKLCDLKPFYGIIHKKDLERYEWWGFGDIDLVYGDLSLLVNEENLCRYDLLTTHVDRIAGHFTVIRKASKYTTLCMRIPNWKLKICDSNHYGMDERDFTRIALTGKYKCIKKVYQNVFKAFIPPYRKFYFFSQMERILRAWPSRMLMREFFTTFVPKPDVTCTFNLENNDIICPTGQITRISSVAGKLYLHFLFFKKTQYLNTDTFWKENFYQIPRDFDFLQGGIVEINTNHIKIRNEET